MTDSFRSETATVVESGQSATSWGAIIAGGIATAALTLVLLAFGSGMGFSAVSPWSNAGVSASTFKLATGVYLIIVSMLSSTIGGYIAGRLRTKWVGLHSEEVLFRDTAHGFLAWAFAAVLGAAVLGAAATYIVGGAAPRVPAKLPRNRRDRRRVTLLTCCSVLSLAAKALHQVNLPKTPLPRGARLLPFSPAQP
jgi:hypothetical protein